MSPVSLVNQAITDAGMRKSDILHTVVIGGSGNIPLIQKSLEWYFGTAPLSKWDVAPEEAAVIGAAMQADILASDVAVGCIFGDVNPHEISKSLSSTCRLKLTSWFSHRDRRWTTVTLRSRGHYNSYQKVSDLFRHERRPRSTKNQGV